MRKLAVFNHVSLDGYFVDANGRMDWARAHDANKEWNDFVAQNSSGEGTLLLGRVTYDLMTSYWPTPMAQQHDPAVAQRMNALPKIVFSRTMTAASWNNTRLINSDLAAAVRKMKQEPGSEMVILGSGSIVAQLAQEKLIDEYQVVVNPVILGKGRTMFEGLGEKLPLKLVRSRTFSNGNAFLCYEMA